MLRRSTAVETREEINDLWRLEDGIAGCYVSLPALRFTIRIQTVLVVTDVFGAACVDRKRAVIDVSESAKTKHHAAGDPL